MKWSSIASVLSITCLAFSTASFAKRLSVSQESGAAVPFIQSAIDSASDGDVILVGPGRYVENIDFKGKNVELRSQSGPSVTIIDGSGAHLPCVRFITNETHAAVLAGFTLTGGRGMPQGSATGPGSGGGILVFESEPTIESNIIEYNEAIYTLPGDLASGAGGGIACRYWTFGRDYSPVILNNIIRNNRCGAQGAGVYVRGAFSPIIVGNSIESNEVLRGDGGGIFVCGLQGGVRISDNVVTSNSAADHGGGIVVCGEIYGSEMPGQVSGNVVANNYAGGSSGLLGSGGGLYLAGTSAWVHSNTLVGNEGSGEDSLGGGGVTIDGGSPLIELNIIAFSTNGGAVSCSEISSPIFKDNILWQNRGGYASSCGLSVGQNGNMSADPLFCDPSGGDYSLAENSPGLGERIVGAFQLPGCPARVPALPTTWSAIKAQFFSDPSR